MADAQSADYARQECVARMGADLGELYSLLSGELVWLNWRWHEFVYLYGGPAQRLDLLNASAPFFFYVVQRVLWDETLLGISRLAGPATTGTKRNLSVHRIPELIQDTNFRAEVGALLEDVSKTSAFAIDLRNRRIAHRDLDVALGTSATPLPAATTEKISGALQSLADVLNAIQKRYLGSTTAYSFTSSAEGAESLVYVLRDGLRRQELREEKLESGEYDPDDWDDHAQSI